MGLSENNALNAALAAFTDPRGRVDIRFGLDRIKQALAILGDPQNKLPTTIHIAGTNGKGSVAAFLRAIGEASGLAVHVFTSPHLIRINERIRIAGRLVTDDELITALERVEDTGIDLTYFEALTASAYLLFSQIEADLCIIETGAGGELDSTNVMARPNACVITNIGRDHEKLFGVSDIPSIARTKAGIMRPDVPVIIAEQTENKAVNSLLEAANDKRANVSLSGRDWKDWMEEQSFVFQDENGQIKTPWLGLAGPHQRMNAGAACAAMRILGLPLVNAETISIGLREASWPARMQALQSGPITRALGARVIVDGAHNPAAAQMLAQSIKSDLKKGDEKPVILMAMQSNKDFEKIITSIAPFASQFVMIPLPEDAGQEGGSSADLDALVETSKANKVPAIACNSLNAAVQEIAKMKPDTVYICGSLYLAGAVLAMNEEVIS